MNRKKEMIKTMIKTMILFQIAMFLSLQFILMFSFWEIREIFWNLSMWEISARVTYLIVIIITSLFIFFHYKCFSL